MIFTFFILAICCEAFYPSNNYNKVQTKYLMTMTMDDFITEKLDSIKRTYEALTERLSDPDLANDRKQMLTVSRERSSMEPTVVAYNQWTIYENERLSLIELDQDPESDQEIKEMARSEIKELLIKQNELEDSITLMLLPKDPNDDRNVMLEIRSGTGGDEAG